MREQAEQDTPGGGRRVSRMPEARSPRSERVKAAAEPQVYRKIKSFLFAAEWQSGGVCLCVKTAEHTRSVTYCSGGHVYTLQQ